MIEIKCTDVQGFPVAIRGMRNAYNSWDSSDSSFGNPNNTWLGTNDKNLMMKLIKLGSDHSKFMRFITVTCDVTAPMYWWKQFDTYKVGTVRNSCSTMHKIADKEFTLDDFSLEHLEDDVREHFENNVLDLLNQVRDVYVNYDKYQSEGKLTDVATKKQVWWQMIQFLPSSYNQKSTIQLNYQVLRSMYHSRKGHKLDEWHDFCLWIESLPYSFLITE